MAPLPVETTQPSVPGVPWIQAVAADTPAELIEPLVSGVPWIHELKAVHPVESIQPTAPGIPWMQALAANAPVDAMAHSASSWSSPLLSESTTVRPDAFSSPKAISDLHAGTLIALVTCISLYVSLALVFGVVATYWHYISSGPECKDKRRFLWFPWYFSIAIFLVPLVAAWGVVQVLVASGLLIIKFVSGREVRRMNRVFSIPPLWKPGGLFKTKLERMNHVDRPGDVVSPLMYTRQALTGGGAGRMNNRVSLDLSDLPPRRMFPQAGPADSAQLLRIPLNVHLGAEQPTQQLSRLGRQHEQL